MVVSEPLAIIALIFAVLASGAWFRLVTTLGKHPAGDARSKDALQQAAAVTAITFALAAIAALAPTILRAFL